MQAFNMNCSTLIQQKRAGFATGLDHWTFCNSLKNPTLCSFNASTSGETLVYITALI